MKHLTWLLLPAMLACATTAASGEKRTWRLWPSPFAGQETLDQSQTLGSRANRVIVRKRRPVGQVFVPRRSPLLRMEFRVSNRYDPRPGHVRLYRWQGSAKRSRKAQPLFEDRLELAGDKGYQLRSVFPRLDVAVGEPLYLEFSSEGRGEFGLDAATGGKDRYRDGHLEPRTRPFAPGWDLWFRTFSGPALDALRLAANDPPFEVSAAGARWQEPEAAPRPGGPTTGPERVRLYTETRRRGVARSCKDSLHGAAMPEALLYRSSCAQGRCDEAAVESLRTLFRNAHALRFCRERPQNQSCPKACDPDPDLRFHWLKPPVLAYLWTRDSPSYRRDDHARIEELLVDSAERLWPKRELGVHNRPMTLATGYLGLAQLFPEHPLASQWRGYAEGIWQEFRSAGDTPEDSAQYTSVVWLPSLLAYAELAGEEEALFRDPAFLALVERLYAQTSPLGTFPNFGDDSGWARDPAGLVWLMEKAAAHTGEARYRWLAERLAAYAATRPRDARPKEDALVASLPYLAEAALDADTSLEPRAPAPQHELPASAQTSDATRTLRAEPGRPVGQSFAATHAPLVRIDLRMRGEGAEHATVSVWRWRGDREASVAGAPLYRERVPLPAPQVARVSLFPFLEVEAGSRLYLEVLPGAGSVALEAAGHDAYEAGEAYLAGARERGSDLWFATFTLSPAGSLVTTRREVRALPKQDWQPDRARRTHVFGERQVPGKLVLRSGFDPRDLHAVVNLLAGYQHGQTELGAFVSLVDERSVLLADTPFPYSHHTITAEDESAALLRRYWGGRAAEPGRDVQVTHFRDARRATVAWLEWDDPAGWGVRQERRILFVKNRFLLVRDRFHFPDAIGASAGPVWHAGDVRPQHGESWFDIGYREPLTNVWKLRNPERYALLYFVPRPGRRTNAFLERSYLPPERCREKLAESRVPGDCRAGPAHVLYQRWTGEAPADTTLWFDTLLLPHGPELTPKQAAGRVRVLYSDDTSVALEVKVGDETWTVVDRGGVAPLATDEIDTDARYALLRTAPGREPYALTRDASRFVRGDLRLSWPVRTSVERGATLPVARQSDTP